MATRVLERAGLRRLSRPLLSPLLAAAFVAASQSASAQTAAAQGVIPFSEADIFFELNATDGDVGVHVSLDAESWRELEIEGPGGRKVVEVVPQGSARQVGLTELFFEGEEPSLAEVPFARFRALFPAGRYLFTGRTTENQALRSADPLTHELPCPPRLIAPAEEPPVALNELVVKWQNRPGVYDPDRRSCATGRNVGLVGFQVIVEYANEARNIGRSLAADLPPGATELRIPAAFLRGGANLPGTAFKLEVIAIEDSGNKTIIESEFGIRGGP